MGAGKSNLSHADKAYVLQSYPTSALSGKTISGHLSDKRMINFFLYSAGITL